ncbi:MAG: hypothetical protein HDR01_08290 [Lachnospiraceae bacterium]|nr:hypothetical protein [Lachnospiraceae bacterium]
MKKITICVRIISFCLIFCLLFSMATEIMKDKRCEGEYDVTNKVKGFYREPENSLDFVFIGSSQLYAHVAPAVLYRDYGITSYDFAANEQPLWISYYYIKEALKHQQPKAIVLEVFTIYGEDYEEEGVNHINLDDLPWSMNKVRAILDGVPGELQYSYFFELAKYHSTWSGFYEGKYTYTFQSPVNVNKGYSPFVVYGEYEEGAKEEVRNSQKCVPIPERAKEWLLNIIELCRQEEVELIFLKTPNGNPERQMLYNSLEIFSKEQNVPFLNLNTILDGEAHVNVLQAEKITQYVGAFLSERYELEDKRSDSTFPYQKAWEESVRNFEQAKQQCAKAEPMDEK